MKVSYRIVIENLSLVNKLCRGPGLLCATQRERQYWSGEALELKFCMSRTECC